MNQKIEIEADVIAALQQGRKIDAIKRVRERSGIGLKDAKELVEQYLEENASQFPNANKHASNNSLLFVIFVCVSIYVAYKLIN